MLFSTVDLEKKRERLLLTVDPNHKPEMALALTPFQALCGFRPLPEIANFLNDAPEFRALIPPPVVEHFLTVSGASDSTEPLQRAALQSLFTSLMTADESIVHRQLEILVCRYLGTAVRDNDGVVRLVLELHEQFPGDIGIFCPFVLNYIRLDPGQAIFLGAGEPHAYIYGGKPLFYPNHHFLSMTTTTSSQNALNAWPIPITSYAQDSLLNYEIFPTSFQISHT